MPVVKLILIASVLAFNAMAGQVRDWYKKYTTALHKLSDASFDTLSEESRKELFTEFTALFHPTVDCSCDPGNPVVGYDLKKVPIMDCYMADKAMLDKTGRMKLNTLAVIDTIVDEESSEISIWFEFGNTGEFHSKFKIREAFRTKIVDGKALGWHVIVDTYNLLPKHEEMMVAQTDVLALNAGSVRDWNKKYTTAIHKLSDASFDTLSEESRKELFTEFTALFHPTVDCSCDPGNPVVGYDLKKVPLMDCYMADKAMLDKMGRVKFNTLAVIDTIVDEESSEISVWFEFGNTGEFHSKFKIREALRTKIVDGKAIGWHVIVDTYNLLPKHEEMMAAQTESFGAQVVMGAAVFGVGFLCSQIIKMKKNNVMLEGYTSA